MLNKGFAFGCYSAQKTLRNIDLVGSEHIAFMTGVVVHHHHILELLHLDAVPVLLKLDTVLAADRFALVRFSGRPYHVACADCIVFHGRKVGCILSGNRIFVIVSHKQIACRIVDRRETDIAIAVGKLDDQVCGSVGVRNKFLVGDLRSGWIGFFLDTGITSGGQNHY